MRVVNQPLDHLRNACTDSFTLRHAENGSRTHPASTSRYQGLFSQGRDD